MATEKAKKSRGPYRSVEKDQLASKGYIPAKDAAEKIGKSTQTIYYWLEQKKVEGVRIGTHWYVKETSLAAYYKKMDPKAVALMGL
jgi:excisionase family DNA binding protein